MNSDQEMMLGAFVCCNGMLDAAWRARLRIRFEHYPQLLKPRSRKRIANPLLEISVLAMKFEQSPEFG
jgi:hypothetical protein